jgi:hypothetical protein
MSLTEVCIIFLVKKSVLPIFALLPEIRLDPAVNLCFSCFTFSMGMKKGYLPIPYPIRTIVPTLLVLAANILTFQLNSSIGYKLIDRKKHIRHIAAAAQQLD